MQIPVLPSLAALVALLSPALAQQLVTIDGPQLGTHGVAYDTARGRAVALGSEGETWECTGSEWLQKPTAVQPPRRRDHAMVYDPLRRHVLVFGGNTVAVASTPLSDTWVWDGVQWRQLFSAVVPVSGNHVTMAFDENRGRVVLASGQFTFEHDGSQWQQMQPVNVPNSLGWPAMAFDPVRGVTLMLAMADVQGQWLPELWRWNGVDWSQLSALPVGSWIVGGNVAFDRSRQRLVLGGSRTDATLEWNGAAWTSTITPGLPREGPAMYFDARLQQVVLRAAGQVRYSAAWAWNGSAWSQLAPEARPLARQDACLGADPGSGRLLLFGGSDLVNYDDTWDWDGHRWQLLTPATRPPATTGAAMCVDPGNGRLAMFGGASPVITDALWHWHGTSWSAVQASVRPRPRRLHGLAGDIARNRLVLFGGLGPGLQLDDTWEWDGSTWTQALPAGSPLSRYRHALVYDPVRAITVLCGGARTVGGEIWLNDTWTWNGTSWQQVAQAAPPSVLVPIAGTFDPTSGKVLVVGHTGAPTTSFQAWEFDGAGWSQAAVQGPRPGTQLRLVHDNARGRNVVFDGRMLLELTPTPAAAVPYGSGCGTALLTARARPRTGASAFGLETSVAAGQPVLFALAFGSASTPLGNGCTLLLQQIQSSTFALADSWGTAALPIPLPANHALRGLVVFAQAGVLAPSAPGGFVVTQGLRIEAGD